MQGGCCACRLPVLGGDEGDDISGDQISGQGRKGPGGQVGSSMSDQATPLTGGLTSNS